MCSTSFERERFEKKFVARVVIGGNRFGIRIDHQRFKAVFLQRKRRVHAAVIKLNALADAVGPAAENHHLARVATGAPRRRRDRRWNNNKACKPRTPPRRCPPAGSWAQAQAFALGADGIFGLAGQMGDLAVGKAERFGFGELFGVHGH